MKVSRNIFYKVILLLFLLGCSKEEIITNKKNNNSENNITFISGEQIDKHFLQQLYSNINKVQKRGMVERQITEPREMLSYFFEENGMDITTGNGFGTQTLILKQNMDPAYILTGKALLNYYEIMAMKCLEKNTPTYNVLCYNYGNNEEFVGGGDITFINFQQTYYGQIQATHINFSTGEVTRSFTSKSGVLNHSAGFWEGTWRSITNFFTAIGNFFSNIYNGFGKLFQSSKCHGLVNRGKNWHYYDEKCKDDQVIFSYKVILPNFLFAEMPQNRELQSEYQIKNTLECSCKTNDNPFSIGYYLGLIESEAVYLVKNRDFNKKICEFLQKNNYSKDSKQFSKLAVKAKIENSSTEIDFDNRIIIDKSFKNNAKAYCVYKKLSKEGGIKKILEDFFDTKQTCHLKIVLKKNLKCNNRKRNGCTSFSEDEKLATIKIDEDFISKYSMKTSGIYKTPLLVIARVITHEAIHANLFWNKYKVNNQIPLVDESFEKLYESYRNYRHWQHLIMSEHYINIISKNLEKVHPLLNDQTFIDKINKDYTNWTWNDIYKNMAWSGLTETPAGKKYLKNNMKLFILHNTVVAANSNNIENCKND